MDPNNRGPEEYGLDADGQSSRQRPPRDPLTPDFGQHTPALARTVQLVSGDFLLTVNPVDGSEIEVCPPAERPARPEKLAPAERAEIDRAARPPVPPGPTRPAEPLLARQDEREQLVRMLARGRSVRLVGPRGAGRTSLLDLVADDCGDLAPDGVIRLTGFHRTPADLLYDLFHAVFSAPLYRPDRDELLSCVREIGAVVVLDDIEFGGAALDELLDATPECAFVIGATPEVPAPSADSGIEEVALEGLDRPASMELLERGIGRVLIEDEANWAGDLWFESEGLPLRFVQAGALLRQRDRLRAGADAVDEYGVFEDASPGDAPLEASYETEGAGVETPLPSLGEAAGPARLLASRLSASARATLRFAVALGGEVPHQAHLPALVGDTHADAALGELADCGLVSPVGSRYRLAAGVQAQLEGAGYAEAARDDALTAVRHYAWWAGHPSVTPERVSAEADAVLAALGVLVPASPTLDSARAGGPPSPPAEGEESPTVQLARTAAPAFAAGLHWGAWERALRAGAEAARLAGDVSEQAYFHHELGILALCVDQLDRARAELETSIGLRGALADKRGTVAGRRALALVSDRSGTTPGVAAFAATAGEEVPDARYEESQSPPGGVPAVFPPAGDTTTLVTHQASAPSSFGASHKGRGGVRSFARRNLVAAGAGALLVAVLGTVVTLGATSDNDPNAPSNQVGVNPSASQGPGDDSLGADKVESDKDKGSGDTGSATSRPTDPGPDGTYGTSDDPTPTDDPTDPSDDPSGTQGPGGGPSHSPTKPPSSPTKPPSSPTKPPSQSPTDDPTPTDEPTTQDPTPTDEPTTQDPTDPPTSSTSASGPASSSPAETTSSASAPTATDADTPSTGADSLI
ncbi:ATP-binding protein [Streptomyces sp. NPDC056464]|uniref:ATP-binding protein n=1 Tax=Streptomyces sp. NPDC056464 TaxID=3345828 RepID=UPI0036B38C52